MSDFKPIELQQLKASLTTTKAELEQHLQMEIQGKHASDTVVLDQTSIGRVSRMDAIQQQSVAVTTRHKAMTRLKKVNAALIAIATADFGYCQKCDEAIDFKRLQAQPESELCLSCQSKSDAVQ